MAVKRKTKIIEVEGLVKKYRGSRIRAVDDISFYVERGAFFSMLGPNGAGKTTVLSILTTLLQPTEGKVKVAGKEVVRQSKEVREEIGVIFQKPSLDQNLTAEENIRFHANLYNLFPYRPTLEMMPAAYQKRVAMLAKVLGLKPEEMRAPVKTLSGGMKRKLEIIRSLMHRPTILFLDEPTTGLDPVSRRSLWRYLREIQGKEKMTIFLTTHYLDEAEGADYVVIIDRGRIVYQGAPAMIKDALIEKYMTVDAINRKKLAITLKKMGLRTEGTGPFKVFAGKKNFQEIIGNIGQKLTHLDIHNPTLEEAYLEIIKSE